MPVDLTTKKIYTPLPRLVFIRLCGREVVAPYATPRTALSPASGTLTTLPDRRPASTNPTQDTGA